MALTNLKTVLTKTAIVTSAKLATPADRIGLGFGPATAYPTDSLSQGRVPAPRNPEPEQLRSRQEQSATQMRTTQLRTGGPGAVPPASSAGCLPLGSSAARVTWSLTTGESWSVFATDLGRNRFPKAHACVVRNRLGRDCQSPDRNDDKQALIRETAPAATAQK